mmetsp:Transcript_6206/g.12643  ORF Transcript_6206/g.12643 Transcript_6206/m.12643 type:complete len:285 (-) Transcript_6206:723-1577(-)
MEGAPSSTRTSGQESVRLTSLPAPFSSCDLVLVGVPAGDPAGAFLWEEKGRKMRKRGLPSLSKRWFSDATQKEEDLRGAPLPDPRRLVLISGRVWVRGDCLSTPLLLPRLPGRLAEFFLVKRLLKRLASPTFSPPSAFPISLSSPELARRACGLRGELELGWNSRALPSRAMRAPPRLPGALPLPLPLPPEEGCPCAESVNISSRCQTSSSARVRTHAPHLRSALCWTRVGTQLGSSQATLTAWGKRRVRCTSWQSVFSSASRTRPLVPFELRCWMQTASAVSP